MNQNDTKSVTIEICKQIIDHPNHAKVIEFDTYTVFRFITSSSKAKKKSFDLDQNLINCVQNYTASIDEDQKLRSQYEQLVKKINPFYNFKDSVKNKYYEINFMISLYLADKVNLIKKSRHLPHSFLVLNPETNKYMAYDEFDSNSKTNKEAVFYTQEEAEANVSKFLNVYGFLSISKSLEIHGYNIDKKLIFTKKYQTDPFE
jgi:hypothetical protein